MQRGATVGERGTPSRSLKRFHMCQCGAEAGQSSVYQADVEKRMQLSERVALFILSQSAWH